MGLTGPLQKALQAFISLYNYTPSPCRTLSRSGLTFTVLRLLDNYATNPSNTKFVPSTLPES
jgi:hypothetical protein